MSRFYQVPERKYARTNQTATMVKSESLMDDWKERVIEWNTFYRKNIHLFIEHYFQVKLKDFQKVWIYQMSQATISMSIATRNSAKTWLAALYALAHCVLYPGSIVSIAAGTKGQAGIMITEKIKDIFQANYPNIAREIKDIVDNNVKKECTLHNGSVIRVVVADDHARGHRTQMNIYEEFPHLKQDILEKVFSPFKTPRFAPYMNLPEYSHLVEEPKEIYISSAYYKHMWWYEKMKNVLAMSMVDDTVKFIAFDWLTVVANGFKTERQMIQERQMLGDVTFQQEYENIPFGENENSFFKLQMFHSNRKLKRAFYPRRPIDDFRRANPHQIKRVAGEVRVVACDIAARADIKNNDNTVLSCIRLIPSTDGYYRELCYMEHSHGASTIDQALRIKQLYSEFESDYCVIDIASAGIGVYDQLSMVTKDPVTDRDYPGWTIMQHKTITEKNVLDLKERTKSLTPVPVIYPIYATAQVNDEIARDLKDRLVRGMLSFLVDEIQGENYVINHLFKESFGKKAARAIDLTDPAEISRYLSPYVQTTEAINEAVNLEYKINKGYIALDVPVRTARKDRYSSLAYGNYFATLLEADLIKETKPASTWDGYIDLANTGGGFDYNFY